MAIEDGGSLGIMLSKGISPDEVPERLELYNKARYDRATLCQELTRLTGGDVIKSTEFDTSKLNCKCQSTSAHRLLILLTVYSLYSEQYSRVFLTTR